ncbi:hypothetical protein [Candidatus Viadribacter manganicus]|uniref:Antitoxin n=1 Tax=Candidatus Viadribacter manganicus TaxID=1759059 RepID=A0A1B1AJ02_9PROT|nr:hypothetical protein [Candidatus Viadribacter manganicus]ANP46544.1 hypothetical protein ATE48_11755 [Candidatus Viadribacter manganicus]
MRSVREHRKKAASRVRKPKGPPVLSTSEARANFAEALETAQVDNAVIGFDRYGRTVAALVPVEAIYMLAGLGKLVDAVTRKEIEEGARAFANNVPYRSMSPEHIAAAVKEKPRGPRKVRSTKPAAKATATRRSTGNRKSGS